MVNVTDPSRSILGFLDHKAVYVCIYIYIFLENAVTETSLNIIVIYFRSICDVRNM
jgi:hypothetical protein